MGTITFEACSHGELKTLAIIIDAISTHHGQPRDHILHPPPTAPPSLLIVSIVTERLIVMLRFLHHYSPLDEAEHIGVDTSDWD